MEELGERVARLEENSKRMPEIEQRIAKLEQAVYRAFGGIAVLTVILQIAVAFVKK